MWVPILDWLKPRRGSPACRGGRPCSRRCSCCLRSQRASRSTTTSRRRAQGTDLLGSLLLTALLSAEAAFGAVALFVAYALCLERGSLLKRAAWCLHGWMLVEAR
jgi:hypothetical protein